MGLIFTTLLSLILIGMTIENVNYFLDFFKKLLYSVSRSISGKIKVL